jgi:hypothetical protein
MESIMPTNSALEKLFNEDQNERRVGKPSSSEEEKRRRTEAELIISDISPTKEDYYHIAVLFNHGSSIDDYKKANEYAQKSLGLGFFQPSDPNLLDNRWLTAATFDRLQIEQGMPQKYGTQRYGRGENIDQLIETKGSPLDREQINRNRAELNLDTLEQEEEKIINPSRKQRGLEPLPSPKSKNAEEKMKKTISPSCSNCGGADHTAASCVRPPQRPKK